MEMCAHSPAASLMCCAAGPPVSGVKHRLLMGLKSGNILVVSSGSAYLMEGIWSELERYLNFKYIH